MRSVLATELRRTTFRFLAPLLALLGVAIGFLNSYPLLATWPNISAVMLDVSHFLTPFFAGLAAWEALRASRGGLRAVEDTSAQPAPMLRLPQLLSALLWVTGTWLVIWVAVVIRASMVGLYGNPEPAALLHSLVLQLAFVVIGMSIGHLLTTWIAVPISVLVPLGLYAATFLDGVPPVIDWTNIFMAYAPGDGTANNLRLFGALILQAVALGVVFAALTMVKHRPYRFGSTLTGVVAVAIIIAGGGLALGQRGQLEEPISVSALPLVTVSDGGGQVELEMLEHYAPVSGELLAAWSRVASLVQDSDLAFTELHQQIDADHLDAPQAFERLYLNPDSSTIVQDSIQESLYDVMSCYRGEPSPGEEGFGVEGTVIVESWLQGRTDLSSTAWTSDPEVPAALAWLHGLSTEDARAWVGDHAEQIRSCSWQREDFGL